MTDWEQIVAVAIPGEPVPCPRPRAGRGRIFMPEHYTEYRDGVRLVLRTARGEWRPDRTTEFAVKLMVYRATRRRVDVDNCAKTMMDAGTRILWEDDSQVTKLIVQRLLDRENPRAEIRVWRVAVPVQAALAEVAGAP